MLLTKACTPPASQRFNRERHFRILNQSYDGGKTGRADLVDDFEVQTGENSPFPTDKRAGRFVPRDEYLRIHYRSTAHYRRQQQCLIVIDYGSLRSPCQ